MNKIIKTIYKVWLLGKMKITEINVTRETDHNYWSDTGRMFKKNSVHEKHFENKEDAINFIQETLSKSIEHAQHKVNVLTQDLKEFKLKHNIQ